MIRAKQTFQRYMYMFCKINIIVRKIVVPKTVDE